MKKRRTPMGRGASILLLTKAAEELLLSFHRFNRDLQSHFVAHIGCKFAQAKVVAHQSCGGVETSPGLACHRVITSLVQCRIQYHRLGDAI